MIVFSKKDRQFLRAVGIVPDARTPPNDGTVQQLEELGIPVTRENYLMLAFAGKPPKEPLDGEIEAMLPDRIRKEDDDISNAPSAGMSDEPSYTTPAGFPICSRCSRSTRNMKRLICGPCEAGTRLILTVEDRLWLRGLKIAR
jgi:hypothetical protein